MSEQEDLMPALRLLGRENRRLEAAAAAAEGRAAAAEARAEAYAQALHMAQGDADNPVHRPRANLTEARRRKEQDIPDSSPHTPADRTEVYGVRLKKSKRDILPGGSVTFTDGAVWTLVTADPTNDFQIHLKNAKGDELILPKEEFFNRAKDEA